MTTKRTAPLRTPATGAVVPDPPWRTVAPGSNEVTVIRQRPLGMPGTRAVSVVQHLASLPGRERKARQMTVKPAGPRNGNYTAYSRIAGLVTWRATFEYELTEAGFHSWMPAPRRGFQIAGGFQVINDAPGSCIVVHYEQYHLPFPSRPIALARRLYVSRTMNTELERMLEGIVLRLQADLHWLEACERKWTGRRSES